MVSGLDVALPLVNWTDAIATHRANSIHYTGQLRLERCWWGGPLVLLVWRVLVLSWCQWVKPRRDVFDAVYCQLFGQFKFLSPSLSL